MSHAVVLVATICLSCHAWSPVCARDRLCERCHPAEQGESIARERDAADMTDPQGRDSNTSSPQWAPSNIAATRAGATSGAESGGIPCSDLTDPATVEQVSWSMYPILLEAVRSEMAAFGAEQRAAGYQAGVDDAMEAGRFVLDAIRHVERSTRDADAESLAFARRYHSSRHYTEAGESGAVVEHCLTCRENAEVVMAAFLAGYEAGKVARAALRAARPFCQRCHGQGRVASVCPDPQCGDSTWDHECERGGTMPCPECAAGPEGR